MEARGAVLAPEGGAVKQLKFSLNLPTMSVRKTLALVMLGVIPVVAAGTALATDPLFFTGTPIARGTTPGQFKIKLQDSSSPADAAILQVTQAPGGHSGWHAHPGPAVVIVKSGELTIQQAKDCSSKTYTVGQVAIEPSGHVHLARNTGPGTLELWITFLDVPVGANPRIDAPDPGC
jgi:quercetin dioxygenase-like cupin family protein